jgi:uncharacterized protein YjbJ (UPF0337 family)
MLNRNERDGATDQAKGRVKQAIGDLTGDRRLKSEGRDDETAGKVESMVGKGQRKIGNALQNSGKKLKRA